MMSQIDIRVGEIEMKLKRIEDRMHEIMGEKTTLIFKTQHEEISPFFIK